MQIFIIEKEENTGEGFWQISGMTSCLTLEIAIREMKTMIEKSDDGEFVFSENKLEATSKNGWLRFRIYPCDVVCK